LILRALTSLQPARQLIQSVQRQETLFGGNRMLPRIFAVLATLWALWLASASVAQEKTGEQDRAVAEIKKLGGKVEIDAKKPGKPVVTVMLANREDITDETLVFLKSLTQLTHLWLASTSVTDEGLTHLKGLKKLQYLYLGGTKVNGSGPGLPMCQLHS
jgi:hypothetical protein